MRPCLRLFARLISGPWPGFPTVRNESDSGINCRQADTDGPQQAAASAEKTPPHLPPFLFLSIPPFPLQLITVMAWSSFGGAWRAEGGPTGSEQSSSVMVPSPGLHPPEERRGESVIPPHPPALSDIQFLRGIDAITVHNTVPHVVQ